LSRDDFAQQYAHGMACRRNQPAARWNIDLICLIVPSIGCRAVSHDLERLLALFPMFGQRIVMDEPTMSLSPPYVDRVLS